MDHQWMYLMMALATLFATLLLLCVLFNWSHFAGIAAFGLLLLSFVGIMVELEDYKPPPGVE